MKLFFAILFTFLFSAAGIAQSFFDQSNEFFTKHVKNGLVEYENINGEQNELNLLLDAIAEYDLNAKKDSEIMAFYINAYNLLVISEVVNNYPVQSPLDIEGFFDRKEYIVAGEKLTLNEIENEKLRKAFQDARVHFVLVCAAMGCPRLTGQAFTPENLEAKLEERTKASLNDDEFIRIDHDKERASISEIFKWYKEDFGGSGKFRDYINKYRKDKIPDSYAFEHYSYDWGLNEKK